MGNTVEVVSKTIEVLEQKVTVVIKGLEPGTFMSDKSNKPNVEALQYQYKKLLSGKFDEVKAAYVKDGSVYQEIFSHLSLDFPDTEDKMVQFFNELSEEDAEVLIKLFDIPGY